MLEGLGATVADLAAPFAPEGGAYGHGRTMAHDHGRGGNGHGARTRRPWARRSWARAAVADRGAADRSRCAADPDAVAVAVLSDRRLRLVARARGGGGGRGGARRRDAGDWLALVLEEGSGRTDAILLGAAWRAGPAAVPELSDLAVALSSVSEPAGRDRAPGRRLRPRHPRGLGTRPARPGLPGRCRAGRRGSPACRWSRWRWPTCRRCCRTSCRRRCG